ncbi:hypothetical protein Cgig2_014133 [Carnegiea gigantea]|uniref:Uncharacterized protein n=1 Tax=Carnegiea gigantea TaxID=171969 RepID=A0A9Q1JXW1_9CARY|nr:hypothetical protein Cgig2_014133 [Carnegiea gigantea]
MKTTRFSNLRPLQPRYAMKRRVGTGSVCSEQIKDHFDDNAQRIIMEIESPCEALMESKTLKEEHNKLFKTKDYRLALTTYEKAMQFLCVSVPLNENEATLMEELVIAINLNIATCWLKLQEFELAKQQCELIMKLDAFNVKACCRRVQALLHMGLKDQARQDILDAIRYYPNSEELKNKLHKIEHVRTQSKEKEPTPDAEVSKLECNHLSLPNSDDISNITNTSRVWAVEWGAK